MKNIFKKNCLAFLLLCLVVFLNACIPAPNVDNSGSSFSDANSSQFGGEIDGDPSNGSSNSSQDSTEPTKTEELVTLSFDGYSLTFLKNLVLETCFLYGYQGSPVEVIIPESVHGMPVTAIGGTLSNGKIVVPFQFCTSLTKIILPDSIRSICNRAFTNVPPCAKSSYLRQWKKSARTPFTIVIA